MIDWSACEDVERTPGKVSGQWLIRGTRIPAQAVIDNAADGFTAEQIAAEIYEGLPVEPARRVIEFAKKPRLWELRESPPRSERAEAVEIGPE